MDMKDFFEKPAVVAEALKKQKGMPIIVEILVFIGVFILSTLAQLLVLLPTELVLLYSDKEYMAAALAGDMDTITEISMKIASSDVYSALSLFTCAGIILVTCLFCKLVQRRKMTSLGFKKGQIGKEYLMGALVGFVTFSVAVAICMLTGSLKMEGFSATFSIGFFILFTLGYMIQGMSEEVLCRGYFMVSVARKSTMFVAILANALIFAVLHLFNTGISVLAFLNLVLFGIFASIYFIKRGNIWGVAAFHSVWNLVQGNVYGIRVSGTTSNCSVFSSLSVDEKIIWNGGEFGLEGGLAVTIVMVAGIILLSLQKAKDVAPAVDAEPVMSNAKPEITDVE